MGPRLRELIPPVGGSQEVGFTQPKAHLLADRCGCDKTLYSAEQLDIRHDEAVLSLRTMMRKVFPLMSRRRGRFMPDRGSKRKVSFNDSQILSIHTPYPLQGPRKKYVNLVKQDPDRARQNC